MTAIDTRPAPTAAASPAPEATDERHVIASPAARRVLAALRIVIGWTFLWAFLDKAFALGFTTQAGNGWLEGGSPTTGYLAGASEGWFGSVFAALSGVAVVDWVFMLGLLGLGIAAVTGMGLRIAAVAGVAIAAMMFASQLPPVAGEATNPVTTTHWYYALLFAFFPLVDAGRTWGLAGLWERTRLVRAAPWLR